MEIKRFPRHSKNWLDGDCKKIKNQFIQKYNLFRNNNTNENQKSLLQIRRQYKALLEEKKVN